jgi:hypothetical protein
MTENEESIVINGTEYPKWAVEKAKEIADKDDNIESMIKAVLLLHEADLHATHADHDGRGYGYSRSIGGILTIKKAKGQNDCDPES